MKTFLKVFSIAGLVFTTSCNNKVIPLQNTYQQKPYEFSTAAAKADVWDKLIDFLTAKGLAIKTIDKNEGLITTDNTSFLNAFAWENKDGSLTNPVAYVVCSKVRGPFTFESSMKPDLISGQWVIRIKQESNATVVDTKLANATGNLVIIDSGTKETHNLIVESTGVFEKSIEVALK